MIEESKTICDVCDKDTGTFYKYKGEDLCQYCWIEKADRCEMCGVSVEDLTNNCCDRCHNEQYGTTY